MFTELRNPGIRNYGKNEDPHAGGRTVFTYKSSKASGDVNIIAGAEWQQSFSSALVYKNKAGQPDTLQSLDDVPVRQALAFLQAAFRRGGWELTAGGSLNFLRLAFRRSVPFPLPEQNRRFNNEIAPRLSVAKTFAALVVYASVAKGFSPPTVAELLPTGSNINLELKPEQGVNYDVGIRGGWKEFSFDVNAFVFSLQNTIAQRRDAGGGDYYLNAGKTAQRGVETFITHQLFKNLSFLKEGSVWVSHTWHHFRYKEFKQLTTDFSGKRLPGVAPHTVSAGVDASALNGLQFNLNYYYSDRIALNDANNEYAKQYHLLNAKFGFEKNLRNFCKIKLTAGVDNALNQTYSLGPDINAFGGRYYNAAPNRSFYLSITAMFLANRNQPSQPSID
jgi:iron complex outermembrane receptor protein